MFNATFGTWDYLVFAMMVAASISIGIYHAATSGQKTTTDYLAAGRTMPILPVALSLIATYQSSIMMLGTPAEGYVYGMQFILGEIGLATGTVLEIVLALNFIGRLKLSSPYEFYERRFQSRRLRLLTNILSCISHLTYMSVVLYGQATALQTVTGFSVYSSVLVTTSAAVIYTVLGGLKAVIWTDVLQFLIMFTGLIAVNIKGTLEAGGATEVWNRAAKSGRLDFSFDPDPTVRHTVWNLVFGRLFMGFGLLISPATMQRISSTKSLTQARWAMLVTAFGMPLLTIVALVEGIVAYGYYSHQRCDPLESKRVDTPNQIVPLLILDVFRQLPGMPGLFLAALFSASLSTVSSTLSAMASITWYDVIKPCRPNMPETRGILVAKGTVVLYGAIGGVFALLLFQTQTKTLLQISTTLEAMIYFPSVALFYLGALVPSANVKGAIAGLGAGTVLIGWLVIGSMLSPSVGDSPYLSPAPTDQCPVSNLSIPLNINDSSNIMMTFSNGTTQHQSRSGVDVLYRLSYIWYCVLGMLVVFLVGTGVSWATGGWRTPADPDLVIHLADIQCRPRPRRHHVDVNSHIGLVVVENDCGPVTRT